MKNLFYVVLLFSLLFSSCTKDDYNEKTNYQNTQTEEEVAIDDWRDDYTEAGVLPFNVYDNAK